MSQKEINTTSPNNYFFYTLTKYVAGIPGLLWFRPKLSYESEAARKRIEGGAILIGNHQGYLDPIYLMYAVWYRRHHFVCIRQFFEGKAGWFFRQFHCIPIDKNNFGMGSFRAILDELKKDELVSMFPEGGVETNKELAAFKSGVVVMALKSRKPIVPVYVKNRTHWYERVRIIIGEPIRVETDTMSFARIDGFAEELYHKEQHLKELIGG